ncbi:MAG: hypothetical protein FGM40_00795 [Rhodocyclaceae bacterium]|nr:hypothetical protein [Rhodocyclaceae bacterium]
MFRAVDISQHPVFAEVFSDRLRATLRRRSGGRLPKAVELAAAFNEATQRLGGKRLPAETMRRWMRGLSVPDLPNFSRLCCFLSMSPAEVSQLLLTDFQSVESHAKGSSQGDVGPRNIRSTLHELIDRIDDDTLSVAYTVLLASQGVHQIGADGRVP